MRQQQVTDVMTVWSFLMNNEYVQDYSELTVIRTQTVIK